MRARIALLAAALICVVLSVPACARTPAAGSPPGDHGFVKPANALLARPGVHPLADGRTLAVGTLHYRDIKGGYWAVEPDPSSPGVAPQPLATFTNTSAIGVDLKPLDGQYVLIEGKASAAKPPAMTVDAFRLVVDVVDPYPSSAFPVSGLYTLERGQLLALGWLDHRGTAPLEGWVLRDEPAKNGAPQGKVLAEITNLEKRDQPILRSGWHIAMQGILAGTAALGPAFEQFDISGGSPPGVDPGQLSTGTPVEWRHTERPGLKDLPGGRKRLVGIFYFNGRTEGLADVEVSPAAPYVRYVVIGRDTVDLTQVESSLPSTLTGAVYAAAEGRITSESKGPFGVVRHLAADSFSIVKEP
jgi:hypothetical protein